MPLSYNGVDLGHVVTEALGQDPERDPSGTDALYTRYSFKVRAVIAASYEGPAGESVTDRAKRVEHLLSQDRKRLVYTGPDGSVYLDTQATPDAGLGPVVTGCTVTSVTEAAWLVNFSVECRIADCPEAPTPRAVLSNRWTESVSYDEAWTCTKRRSGLLVVAQGQYADGFRGLITPSVPEGFRRRQANYEVDETGLRAKYSFEDRELHRPPPFPALKLRGSMSETVPMPGAVRNGEISLRLEGPKGVPHAELIAVAVRIGVARAIESGIHKQEKSGRFLMGGAIKESLDDDVTAVELSLRWMMSATKARDSGSALGGALGDFFSGRRSYFGVIGGALSGDYQPPTNWIKNEPAAGSDGVPLGYGNWVGRPLAGTDPKRGIAPPTRGTAEYVGLFAAALGDPCGQSLAGSLRQGVVPNYPNVFVAATPSSASLSGQTLAAQVGDAEAPPDDEEGLYSDASDPGVYENYDIVAQYNDDPGTVVMPATTADGPVTVARLHGGLMTMIVKWTASRVGGRPALPSTTGLPNMVYTRGMIEYDGLDLVADGKSPKWVVSGRYEFAFLNRAEVNVTAPLPPQLSGSVAPAAASAGQLVMHDVLFGQPGGPIVNPFTGQGLEEVKRSGGGTLDTALTGGTLPIPPGSGF